MLAAQSRPTNSVKLPSSVNQHENNQTWWLSGPKDRLSQGPDLDLQGPESTRMLQLNLIKMIQFSQLLIDSLKPTVNRYIWNNEAENITKKEKSFLKNILKERKKEITRRGHNKQTNK